MKLELLALALSLVSGPPMRAAVVADEPPAGAASLLNGRDLAGWLLYLGDVKLAAGVFGLQLEKFPFEVRRIWLPPL